MIQTPESERERKIGATRRRLQRLGPYQALLVLMLPVSIVEPLKLVAVAIVGSGHWFTGTAVIVFAYLASFYGIHRLFLILKPRLFELRWFATGWRYFVSIRRKASSPFRRWSTRAAPRQTTSQLPGCRVRRVRHAVKFQNGTQRNALSCIEQHRR
jgi:hypothetical protein